MIHVAGDQTVPATGADGFVGTTTADATTGMGMRDPKGRRNACAARVASCRGSRQTPQGPEAYKDLSLIDFEVRHGDGCWLHAMGGTRF